ncbi:MAG: hypothetical protein SAJ37_06605 [Oscillatoria sp. PMC 1068.18]|nr:hypothetical protein [Oscillatoria sp. PMC 1076.18]MEC4988403.1 hypothetical protein [Oscillatoria sp. PMC 1068.18]
MELLSFPGAGAIALHQPCGISETITYHLIANISRSQNLEKVKD